MIELRWLEGEFANGDKAKPRLQYRVTQAEHWTKLTDWQDVPVVVEPAKPDDVPACCGGGPQWGHAYDCPKCPD